MKLEIKKMYKKTYLCSKIILKKTLLTGALDSFKKNLKFFFRRILSVLYRQIISPPTVFHNVSSLGHHRDSINNITYTVIPDVILQN